MGLSTRFEKADAATSATLTDSSGGAASATLAATAGVSQIGFPIVLVDVANGDIVTTYTPGYKFKLLSNDWITGTPVTTASKLSTLNAEIGTVNVTGGAVALTSANCTPIGAEVAGTAITALNTGSATDTISIEAASTTPFIEGAGTLFLTIQNMDVADALASLAAQVNAVIADNVSIIAAINAGE